MYIPLRVHSVYSKGGGSITLKELPSWVCRRKFSSAALTDVENIYGWGEWKRTALENGCTPLFGCEMELQGKRLLFLVKSREGYWNMMEIFNSYHWINFQSLASLIT
ncbi:MAG: PHP domain-containing protein [Candidatus Aminicenantes bacterium]|nr:MAG: PHP domain-containing protein [Candidatus Aminicenantes bacterium]